MPVNTNILYTKTTLPRLLSNANVGPVSKVRNYNDQVIIA